MNTFYMKLAKKYFLVFLFFHICLIGGATNYYVSNSGNDSNTGLAPDKAWQTLAKVNSAPFVAGDQILFECGSIFYGTLNLHYRFGINGNPITYRSYGTGNKPKISGFTTITGWTDEGNGVYSKILTSESQTNMVVVDGIQYAMGRYPNSGYLTFESANANVSITDNNLPNSPNWAGAEIVLKKNDYTLDRATILTQNSGVITYNCIGTTNNASAPNNYFIQNSLKTLDQFGEWYHDENSGKFYMYFGTINPDTKTVKVATLDYLIKANSGEDYNTFDNISFEGSVKHAIYLSWQNDNIVMQNCDISFSGLDGINISGVNDIIRNNSISNCNREAVYANASNIIISENYVNNCGLIEGQGNVAPYYKAAFFINDNFCRIEGNNIMNTAYNGIVFSKNVQNALVKNNLIFNSCKLLSDQGSIYLYGAHSDILIDGNILIGSKGNGVYLDEVCTNTKVWNNTISECAVAGIKLHKAQYNSIKNNTCYNNGIGIDFENWLNTDFLKNDSVVGNYFISKTANQICLNFAQRYPSYNFGIGSNNIYARPVDDSLSINVDYLSSGTLKKTLDQWKKLTGQDITSKRSPIKITDQDYFAFFYNGGSTDKLFNLDYSMIDFNGKKYSTIDTLKPFSSIVLLKDPNPAKSSTEHIAICDGGNYLGWTVAGTYTRTLKTKTGADSIVTTYLTVNPVYTVSENIALKAGESYNGWTKTGTYTRTLSSVTGCDSIITTHLTVDTVVVKQGEVLPTHFVSVWQNQTAITPMTIKVVAATKDDLPLAIDDEIALYSGSLCVGSLKLTQPIDSANKSTFISIPASLNDGSGNGFTNNDTIIVKIWDDANHREMVVQRVKYHTDDASWLTTGRYSVNATSVIGFKSYTESTQTISLAKGYNMMSTFVSADNPDVSAVTKPLTDAGTLVKVQDEYGNSYENWGSYGGWVNNLGIMKSTEGYKVKVDANCTLQVTGRTVVLPLDIPLSAGWNIISFPLKNALDAMSVIQPLIDQNKLIKVQDEAGNSIEDWGAFGGWVNGIGNFTPGKAYKIKVNSSATLTIK